MISTVKPVKFDTNAMVNFKPAVFSLNIKQVIMANTGLKSDKKKPRNALLFVLFVGPFAKSELKSQRVLLKLKQPTGLDAFMEIIRI